MPKKSHKTAIIVSVIAGVVVLLCITVAVLAANVFLNPRTVVERAVVKTFSEGGYLYDTLGKIHDYGKEYAVESNLELDMNSEYSDSSIELYARLDVEDNEKQLAGTIEYNNSWLLLPEIEYRLQLDDNELRLQVPTVDSRIFTYSYTEEKSGYLSETVSAEELQYADQILKLLSECEPSEEFSDSELGEDFIDWCRGLQFEKIESADFEIDGDMHKCKGYSVQITGDDVTDATIRFYIYKRMLACVEMETSSETFMVEFHGGDYRAQNVDITENGTLICSIDGTLLDDTETINADFQGHTASLQYDRATGACELCVDQLFEMKGVLSVEKKEISFTMDQVTFEGDYSDYALSGDFTMMKGARIDSMQGEVFDIGNADEEDYNELLDGLSDIFYELIG